MIQCHREGERLVVWAEACVKGEVVRRGGVNWAGTTGERKVAIVERSRIGQAHTHCLFSMRGEMSSELAISQKSQ
jgi:hypothetical protein